MSIIAMTKSLRFCTWVCVLILAVLSLLPARAMVHTGFPDVVNHFIAYAGSAAIAMAGYGKNRTGVWILAGLCVYAGALEYLQQFSPGRDPGIDDFVASSIGALVGGIAALFLWPRLSRLLLGA